MAKSTKDIFKEFYPQLLEILPVDCLINEFFSKQLLSSAHKSSLQDISTNRGRAKYWCLLFCGTERNGTPDSAKYLFCGTHRNGPKTASQLSGYYIEMYPKQVALISLCSKLERNGKCARFCKYLLRNVSK